MRVIATCAGLSILLTLVVNPTDAQVQQSQPRTVLQQPNRAIVPAANKARLASRFHQLSDRYRALEPGTAKYAHARSTHPALRQTRSEIISTTREIENLKHQITNQLDTMSEMGEMESLRLQMAMDRLSKLMGTLSNLLKKASETSAGITQNLK